MDFLVEESKLFDEVLGFSQARLTDAITMYDESVDDFNIVVESEKASLITKAKKFFADIIAAIQNLKASIQTQINSKLREATFKAKLDSLHRELKEKDSKGIRKIEIVDVWTMRREYLDAVSKLKTYSNKFAKMNYRNTIEIDKDISKFNQIMDEFESKLSKLENKKVTVDVKAHLKFIEDEISGRSKIVSSLNDAITVFEQMKVDVAKLETKESILGPHIIPKHVGFLKKIGIRISAFIKKWTVKIISTLVLLFTF